MRKNSFYSKAAFLFTGAVYLLISSSLTACGGDSGDDGVAAASSLTGTVATGKAVAGIVYIKGARGNTVQVSTDPAGAYVAAVENLTAPFLLKVVPENGSAALYSYGTKAGQTVNVTSLSNLAVFLANGNRDLEATFASWTGKSFLASAVEDAQKIINANLRQRFQAAGLNPDDYNFITTTFSANGKGFDAVLDDVVVAVNSKGGNFSVAVLPQPGFAFDVNISVAGINISFTGGAGPLYDGSLAIVSDDPDLPETFSPAAGFYYNNAGYEEIVWVVQLDNAGNVSLQVAVTYPYSNQPEVALRFADTTIPSNPVTKIWQNYYPGDALVVDQSAGRVTFTDIPVSASVTYGLRAVLTGSLSYK